MSARFIGTCVGLPARHLHAYDDSSREVGYRWFLHYVGYDTVRELERELGYAGSGLTLKRDCCVSYSTGKWRGRQAVCMMWSSIHHLWYIK